MTSHTRPRLPGIDTLRDLSPTRVAGIALGVATVGLAIANSRNAFNQNNINNTIPQNLIFPRDLSNYSLSMSFDIMKYKRRSIFKQPYIKPDGRIRLPIAKNIEDKFSMGWNERSQSPLVGAAIEQILSTGEFGGGVVKDAKTAINGILSSLQGAGQGFGIEELQRSVQEVGQGLGRGTGEKLELQDVLQPLGLAVNPFLTVMFEKPEFKTHTFTWKFIPRDPEEARIINKIITLFKYALLPNVANQTSGTLLNYPDMVQVAFYGGDNYLFRFKPCVITNFSANYAPANTPSFFKGSQNVPTEIDISMTLKEIEYWTKVDFDPYKEPIDANQLANTGGYSPNNP